jgi:hypothetical protein
MYQVSNVVARPLDRGISQRGHQARPKRREPLLSLSQSTSQLDYAMVFLIHLAIGMLTKDGQSFQT